ncbi:MAG: hypothetical protein JWQ19_2080 [Subtercola sp.]|nr:hypothetical protein [Subtercola sp.]
MKFGLDEIAQAITDEMSSIASARLADIGHFEAHDDATWKSLAEFGLLTGSEDGMRDLDVAVGFMGVARGGLPGPLLEAELAGFAGSERAVELLRAGRYVSSVAPGPAGPVIVGWGAVADLIVDQATGATLVDGSAEPVDTALPMEHGVISRPEGGDDPLRSRRWLLGSALLVGLGKGAIELAANYVKSRVQFGRPLSSFQAVQFRLAESVTKLDAAELMVLDAARRSDAGDPMAEVAAALAWIYATESLLLIEKHVHQVFGAIGFTTEMGVIRFTYQISWLRTSVGRDDAIDLVLSSRDPSAEVPASIVFDGFATAS